MRISDWSSDVCSSDLARRQPFGEKLTQQIAGPFVGPDQRRDVEHEARRARVEVKPRRGFIHAVRQKADRKSVVEGTSVSVRVDLGGRRIIKKKHKTNK